MRPAVKLDRVAARLRQSYGPCGPPRRRENPPDTHVFRVCRRLGLLDGRPTRERAQELLESRVRRAIAVGCTCTRSGMGAGSARRSALGARTAGRAPDGS